MRLKSPRLVWFAGQCCAALCWLLYKSLRKTLQVPDGVSPYNATGNQRFLFSVWHDSAVSAAFGGRHSRTVALTSGHRDGSFVESVVGFLGVGAVRGSTGRTGRPAARRLLAVAETKDIVITPDGPRGPARTMSRGIVYLASKTGNSIVPTAFACAKAWEIPGSWTIQIVPKPFSRIVLMAGEPIFVPPDLLPREIEPFRQQIQLAMEATHERATAILNNIQPVSAPELETVQRQVA